MISPERIAELRAINFRSPTIVALLDEIERLRAVIRETHYDCMGMGPGRHVVGYCKLHEIEP